MAHESPGYNITGSPAHPKRTRAPLVSSVQIKGHLNLLHAFAMLREKLDMLDEGVKEEVPFMPGDKERFSLCCGSLLGEDSYRAAENFLPPLDVLMLWHEYMLNPGWYAEDCTRIPALQHLWQTTPIFSASLSSSTLNTLLSDPTQARLDSWKSRTLGPARRRTAAPNAWYSLSEVPVPYRDTLHDPRRHWLSQPNLQRSFPFVDTRSPSLSFFVPNLTYHELSFPLQVHMGSHGRVVRRASSVLVTTRPSTPSIASSDRDADSTSIKGVAAATAPSTLTPAKPVLSQPSPIAKSPARERAASQDEGAAPQTLDPSPLAQLPHTASPVEPEEPAAQTSPVQEYTPPPLIDSTAAGPGGFTDEPDELPQPQVIRELSFTQADSADGSLVFPGSTITRRNDNRRLWLLILNCVTPGVGLHSQFSLGLFMFYNLIEH